MTKNISMRDMNRAQLAQVLPCVAQMKEAELHALGLNPDAVSAVMQQAAPVAPSMHGVSAGSTLSGMQVLASKGIKKFYDLLAPLGAFSTTYAEDYVVAGRPGVLPKLEVPVYDDTDTGAEDNFGSFAERTDGGTVTGAEVELHKRDKVITIYARDIQQGVNIEQRIEAALSAIARGIQESVFSRLAVGKKDSTGAAVAAITVPAAEEFDFGYANQELTEAIQPRVNAMLLASSHYGKLKKATADDLGVADLDVDLCCKVEGTAAMGANTVGLLTNKRGAAIGLAAPYMMQGAYASYEQFTHAGQQAPISCCTWYDPNTNCIKIWLGVYVGVAITDAKAIVPLVTA